MMKNSLYMLLTLFSLSLFGSDPGHNLSLGLPSNNGQVVNRLGYAFSYSEKHEQPLWIMYELTKKEVLTKVAKRRDNFRKDPLVKTGSALLTDYKGSGYDRGHLAPAADMAWSVEAMSESFFLSNMSPQNPSLNRGLWAQLESKCRDWAVANDSVYIITGPVIRPNYSFIGPNKVTVPQWYYKICVSVKKQQAIAFLIPNSKPQKKLSEFVVSIDKLEEATGLDFLDKLPKKVESKIEAHSDIAQWNMAKGNSIKKTKEVLGAGSFWISSNSQKRHNSSCRWFKKSKGKLGLKSTGVACKICGG